MGESGPGGLQPAQRALGVGVDQKHDGFVRLSGSQFQFVALSGFIAANKGEIIEREMHRAAHVLRGRLLGHRPGFVEAIEAFVGVGDILKGVNVFGVDAHGLAGAGQGLLLLPDGLVAQREVVARRSVARVGLHPLFVDFDGLLHVPGDNVIVMRGDIEPFTFAGSLLQVESFGDKTVGQPCCVRLL